MIKKKKSAAVTEYSNSGFDSELFVLTHMDSHADDSKSAHSCTCKGRRAHAIFSNHRQELHLPLQISDLLYFSMDKKPRVPAGVAVSKVTESALLAS